MRLKAPYFYENKKKDVAFHQPKSFLTRSSIKIFFLTIFGPIFFCYIILSSSNFLLFMDFDNFISKNLDINQSTKLKEIHVIGRENINKSVLLEALELNNETPMTSINVSLLKEKILSIGWVKDVIVERRMPNTLIIKIEEYKPFALLQTKDKHIIISSEGKKIEANNGNFNYLPVINGVGAEKHAAKMLNILSSEPNLFHQVWAISYIGKRRWDVSLRSGVEIKLPEKNPSEAWAKLSEMDRSESLLSREINVIDLRKNGYLIIKPSENYIAERST